MTLEEKIAQLHGYWFPKSGVLVDDQLRPALAQRQGARAARARPGRDLAPVRERGPQEEPRPAADGGADQRPAAATSSSRPGSASRCSTTRRGCTGCRRRARPATRSRSRSPPASIPTLVEEVMTAVARETRARGAQHTLAPVVDVMRDPRWGAPRRPTARIRTWCRAWASRRCAACRGAGRKDAKIDANHVMATLKHFAVHGQPEGGHQRRPGQLFRARDPRGVPAAVRGGDQGGGRARRDARVRRDRRRARARQQAGLLQDILRKEWGFDGLVVSRLLRDRAAQVAAFRRATATRPPRGWRWSRASTSSCPTPSCIRCWRRR